MKRFLLSRSTVITLIFLILLSILIGYVFPQRMTTSQFEIEQWQRANPFWSTVYLSLDLDHVYTSWWFSSLLFFFLVILATSTWDQIRRAIGKTFGKGTIQGTSTKTAALPESELTRLLKKSGFRRLYRDETRLRFVKQPWGYWGNVLLHLGILFVIGSSLVLTVTEQRGLLHLVEGESYLPGNPWIVEESGLLAERFILPVSIRLDRVIAEFWDNDDVKNVSTIVNITDDRGQEQQYDLGINRAFTVSGQRLYQGRRLGKAFFVVFTDREGKHFKSILQMEHPRRRDKPSYGNYFIEGIPYMLKAKYYADAEMKTMDSTDPLLTLRFVRKEQSISDISLSEGTGERLTMTIKDTEDVKGEASLKIGESSVIGDYMATLIKTEKWSGVIFVSSIGMSGIFTGFFIIVIGVSFTYFFSPREIIAEKTEGSFALSWKASRFEEFYEDEFREVQSTLNRTVIA